MNILVTGGTGYIGTELVYALEPDPSVAQIVVYDNLSRSNYNLFLGKSKLPRGKVRFVQGDILDSYKLKREIEQADVVFHLAAKVTTPFANHNPHEFDQVNNWGTAELSYLVEKSQVAKLIYASSVSVYGASEEEAILGMPMNPNTFYGISKLHGEQHVDRLNNRGIQVFVLRLGNAYGYSKSMRFDSVINKFMFEANFSNKLRIFGDGSQMRSFIHIARLSTLLKNMALTDIEPGTYNLVENTYTINEIATELKLLYPQLEMVYVNQNIKMRSLVARSDDQIYDLPLNDKIKLMTDLKEFKEQFCF